MNTVKGFIQVNIQGNTVLKILQCMIQITVFDLGCMDIFAVAVQFRLFAGDLFLDESRVVLEISAYFLNNIGLWTIVPAHILTKLYAVDIQITANSRN